MYGIQYFGDDPVKNEAFRLYFRLYKDTTSQPQQPETSIGTWLVGISKDGGELALASGTPVAVTNNTGQSDVGGWYYIDLTASEMNANYVCIGINETNRNAVAGGLVIKTKIANQSTVTSAFSPTILTFIIKAINNSYDVAEIDLDNSGYNYYGLIKNSQVYIIVRESTDFSSLSYYLSNITKKSFAIAWANRITLNYSSSTPSIL